MRDRSNRLIMQVISLVILVAALVIPRAFALGHFVAIDEVNWLHRSATFYDAVVRNRWSHTLVSTSPGIITSWVGALAIRVAAPDYRVTSETMVTSYTAFEKKLAKVVSWKPIYILALARAIMISFLIILLLICYFYAQRLFGLLPSLVGFLIIALDPFLIALTRMNHLDAPQAVFMVLSLLSFLSYLYRGRGWFDLIVSGAGGGLAFLSKLPGILIMPMIGLLSIGDYIRTKSSGEPGAIKPIRKMLQSLLVWGLVFILAYVAFWPAMWVQPLKTTLTIFEQTYSYSSTIVQEDLSNLEMEINPYAIPDRSLNHYLRYPESYLWRTTPVVLVGLLLLFYAYITKKDLFNDETVRRSILGILLFVVVYTVGMTLPAKSSEKYYAPVHIVMCLLAGLGWYSFSSMLSVRFNRIRKEYVQAAILIVVLLFQSFWVYRSFPYYFTYYNPMLGGLQRAAQIKFIGVGEFVGVGEGLDQAGLYLQQKPDSSKLHVMSWYGIGPLSYYFDGEVEPLYIGNSYWAPDFIDRLRAMDYLVVYIHTFRPRELLDLLEDVEPEYTVTISGVEYAWIYKVSDISLPESWLDQE